MSWILYVLLVLAVAGDILLAVVLAKVMHKNDEPQQKIDTADDFVRAVTPVLQSETDLLAEQLRAMQGESARTTTATLRDFSAVLAENQRQNAAASTARLESIDRAGAARQKAANDALLAQLTMMETRLKNLEDSNATRMDSVRGALVQGLNTIRADNNKKLDEIRGTVEEKLQDTLQQRINDSFKTVSAQLEQVYKGLGEMQNLAADVGSLKQVLSGVKTRGILGEVQLGAILEQILAPGQYACNERLTIVGPKKEMANVSILGPTRKADQVEVSATDARTLGIDAPIRESGDVKGSGACKLIGPAGEVELSEGVIVAKRHLHVTEEDAAAMGIKNGEIIKVACGGEGRKLIFDDVVVRVNVGGATTMHIDTDESQAANGPTVGELVR